MSAAEHAYDAYARGQRLLDGESPHAAAVALERARALEPEQGSIRESLARADSRTGRDREAGEEFARAVELDPVDDGAHRHLELAVAMRPERLHDRRALRRVHTEPR